MTFSLRRKRQTTAPTSPTAGRTSTRRGFRVFRGTLVCSTLLALAHVAQAQTPTPALRIDPAVQRVMMQMQTEVPRGPADSETLSAQIQLTPPGPERIFARLDS